MKRPGSSTESGKDIVSKFEMMPDQGKSKIPPPFMISYAITSKCNLKCKHCYSDSSEDSDTSKELTNEESKKVIDQIADWGIQMLIMDGGEPTEREDLPDLVYYATLKGVRTVIGTNATKIDAKLARKLKDAGVMAAQISVDGANSKTHDWFRGEEGSFDAAMAGAKVLREVGIPFQFGATVRRGTLKEIPRILDLAVESGAMAAEMFDLVEVKRVKKLVPNEILTPEERKEIWTWLAKKQEDYPLIIRSPGCPMYPLLLNLLDIKPKHFPYHTLYRIPYFNRGCAAGYPNGYMTILPDGNVIPCMLLQINIGNVREKTLYDIWDNSKVCQEVRDRSLLKGECGKCEHLESCAGCRGRAYEVTGDYLETDPGCWMREGKLL